MITVSRQLEHNRREYELSHKANHMVAGILWIAVMGVLMAYFTFFGWLAVSRLLVEPRIVTYGFSLAAVVSFVFAGIALFKGLDELFFQTKNDRRQAQRRRGDR